MTSLRLCQFKFERKDINHVEQIIIDYSPVKINIPEESFISNN